MNVLIRMTFVAALSMAGSVAAADFDGSKRLICAPVEAMDCVAGAECIKGNPDDIGAPAFMRIDFAGKAIAGPGRTTPIKHMETAASQVLLQGTEVGYAWALALDRSSGKFSATLTNREGTFVLFGSCTPL